MKDSEKVMTTKNILLTLKAAAEKEDGPTGEEQLIKLFKLYNIEVE